MDEVRCVVEARDVLGEGPFWDVGRGRLWWFDIKGRRLSWHAPATGETGAFPLTLRASAGAARTDGRLLLAAEQGLATFDPASGGLEISQPMTFEAGFRSNDGQLDVRGRFWWSIMDDDAGRRPGAVFRTDSDQSTERVLEGVHIPNSLAVSPDGSRLYQADSPKRTIWVHDLDAEGRPSGRREFATTHGQSGFPDGSTVDAEGYLWNAQWAAWRIVRFAPDGAVDRIVPVPVQQPTCCCFGGADLATLFVTSAREGISDEDLQRQPLAGGLFALDPGVTGLALPPFAG